MVTQSLTEIKGASKFRRQLRTSLGLEELARWFAQVDDKRWHECTPDEKHIYRERSRTALLQFFRGFKDPEMVAVLSGGAS
jgi:hypothetical protein